MKEFPFLMHTVEDSDVTVNVVMKDETIGLSQKGMAELIYKKSGRIRRWHPEQRQKKFPWKKLCGNLRIN